MRCQKEHEDEKRYYPQSQHPSPRNNRNSGVTL